MATPSKFNFEEKVNIYETASSPKPNCIIIKKIANNPDCKTQTRETKKRFCPCVVYVGATRNKLFLIE